MTIETSIATSRKELLELSTRNRLLSCPRGSKTAKVVEVVDEKTEEVLRLLLVDGKKMTFSPAPPRANADEDDVEPEGFAQPDDDDDVDEDGVAKRHRDTKLQTKLQSAKLQKRLLTIFYDAATAIEEQGINILYLALGSLRWQEAERSDTDRFAPLVLIPVKLERGAAAEKFTLAWSGEELSENFSLTAKLKADFGIKLPEFPDFDSSDPSGFPDAASQYFEDIERAISGLKKWAVLPDDMILGFFSFAKFLMYRDLDPAAWPETKKLDEHPLLQGLLQEGFARNQADDVEPDFIDPQVPPERLVHIVDADSSQTMAIEAARLGRNLVIQGPPGTGKSQTIANLIAGFAADGKKILFVAEKMAALDVVKRRLDKAGIGRIALELHSNKTNKRAVLEELRRTRDEAPSGEPQLGELLERLTHARDGLTAHAVTLHTRHPKSNYNAYEAYGHVLQLQANGHVGSGVDLPAAGQWPRAEMEMRRDHILVLADRLIQIGNPAKHPWRGVRASALLPKDVETIGVKTRELAEALSTCVELGQGLAALLKVEAPTKDTESERAFKLGEALGDLPPCDRSAFSAPEWTDATKRSGISDLVRDGQALANQRNQLLEHQQIVFAQIRDEATTIQSAWRAIRDGLSVDAPPTAAGCLDLADVIDAVSLLPQCDPTALLSPVWKTDGNAIAALVSAGAKAKSLESQLRGQVSDVAWTIDLSHVRAVLTEFSRNWFRIFFGRYRSGLRALRSVLAPASHAKLPSGDVARLELVDALSAGRQARALIAASDSLGRQAFGRAWNGLESDWSALERIVAWQRKYGENERATSVAARGLSVATHSEHAAWIRAHAHAIAVRAMTSFRELNVQQEGLSLAGSVDDLPWSKIIEAASDPIQHVDAYLQATPLARSFSERETVGRRVFGAMWKGAGSDWARLQKLLYWHSNAMAKCGPLVAQHAVRCSDPTAAGTQAKSLRQACGDVKQKRDDLIARLKLDSAEAFSTVEETSYAKLSERIAEWQKHPEGLTQWIGYRALLERANELGLKPLTDRLCAGTISPQHAAFALQGAFFDAVLRDLANANPALSGFDGELQDKAVHEFRTLDDKRLRVAKHEVLCRHSLGLRHSSSAVGPMGVLNQEIAKKRRHHSLRKLMQLAGPAVQALKPVFMMSPLSVAQFLEPGKINFDVLIIDEASQVLPVDALGAIARVEQIVVVGDEKQMPPTRFFSRLTSDDEVDPDESDEFSAADAESILGLCQAKGVPSRMLRWHYRSKHQSLIAVSNAEYYDNKLFIVPSPWTKSEGRGLQLRHLPNSVYDRGGTATNAIEARAVAEAVIAHARNTPDSTLGVATFSVKQRQQILDELERLRRENPDTEGFFGASSHEPFFVKNLENIQGDERDVIFISVCYGRDKNGYITMSFGPLSSDGGERRLNVLISRARLSCQVFSPIVADDIDLDRAKSKGVRGLKTFLNYAKNGQLNIASASDRDFDSPFEEAVSNALASAGFDVRRQVGQSGFFVDLAIVDPANPGRYTLGIECDGAAYHSSRSARDRDRLRQAVLESHGWIIHRIWSTDWFRRPQEELRKVAAAFEQAQAKLAAPRSRVREASEVPSPLSEPVIVPPDVASADQAELTAEPYVEARFPVPYEHALHETSPHELAPIVSRIVEIEGPIHRDEVIARVRDLWILKRAGNRIQAAVMAGILMAIRNGDVVETSDQVLDKANREVRVRNRYAALSPSLKKPELLPPSEIQASVLLVLGVHHGATRSQLQQIVARLFGFQSTSQQLRFVIDAEIDAIIERGAAREDGDYVLRHGD